MSLLHLQDYNKSVLQLCTLPNIMANLFLADSAREHLEMEVTPEMHTELQQLPLQLAFFAGDWTLLPVFIAITSGSSRATTARAPVRLHPGL